MKKTLFLLLMLCTASGFSQNVDLLKKIAFENTDNSGALDYAKQIMIEINNYEFHDSSKQANSYFVNFRNIDNEDEILSVIFSDIDDDGVYAFSEIRGSKNAVFEIWKTNFNPNHKLSTFSSNDRYKNTNLNLNFSFYVNAESASIKDFS